MIIRSNPAGGNVFSLLEKPVDDNIVNTVLIAKTQIKEGLCEWPRQHAPMPVNISLESNTSVKVRILNVRKCLIKFFLLISFFMAFHWIFSWQTVFAGIKTQLLWMIAFELLPLADEVVGSNFFSHDCYSVRWESHMTITHDVLDLTNRDPTPWTCSNLFSLDLTAVQSSHPSGTGPGFALPPYGWWAGHWHPTRMFSCWSILWDRSFCWIRWIGLGINLYIIRTPFL